MKTMFLGKTSNIISRIGLGTWAIGGGPAWGGDKDIDTCISTICSCNQLGINVIDTAPGYNFGNSEKIVGNALKKMNRSDMCLITKCGLIWNGTGTPFNKVGNVQLYRNLTPESILKEISQSLERLQTDYVDVYMTHWQSIEPYNTPISETMAMLNELKNKGKIKAIGAANVTVEDMQQYLKYGSLDIVQAKYSILDRKVETDILPFCRLNGITLQAYSPLEQGLLSGTLPRNYTPTGAQCNKEWYQIVKMQKAMNMLDDWKPLCEKYNCSIANLALAWVFAQDDCIQILSGSITKEELAENAKSVEIIISDEDLLWMRQRAMQAAD